MLDYFKQIHLRGLHHKSFAWRKSKRRGSRVVGEFSRVAGEMSRVAGKLLRVAGKLSRVAGRLSWVPKIVAGERRWFLLNATLLPTNGCFDANPISLRVHLFTITIPTKFSKFFALGSSLALKSSSISRWTSCNFLQNRLFSFVCFLLTCLLRASKNKNSF